MLKRVIALFSAFLISCSLLLAAENPDPGPMGLPPRTDKIDSTSVQAQFKLKRAEAILATLVRDPQNYQLILSSRTSFGGEAITPGVLSDKPTIVVYQGALAPGRSNEEIAFMMAHELGHLHLYHNQKMDAQMEQIFTKSPVTISGVTYAVYFQKFQEREADLYGLKLYQKAGYDLRFFPYTLKLLTINPNIHYGSNVFRKERTSLSYKDTHFKMQERFALLVKESQGLA